MFTSAATGRIKAYGRQGECNFMSNAEITVPARAASQYDDLLKQKKKNKRKADFKRLLPLYLMMLPGLVYLLCNNYLPMFGILFAFKKMNFSVGVLQSPWCGLQNFEFLFKTKDAWIMIRNTLLYNIVWIAMGTVIAVFIAILMAEISARPAAKVIQPII